MTPETPKSDSQRTVGMLIIIVAIYILLQHLGILNFLIPSALGIVDMSYGLLFVIGLLASVHCIAMCGGINLSQCLPHCITKNCCCIDGCGVDSGTGCSVDNGVVGGSDGGIDKDNGGRINKDNGRRQVAAPTERPDDVNAGVNNDKRSNSIINPSIQYNLGRITSYTLIGAAAGALGSAITFSVAAQGVLKLAAGMLMVIIGINMLNIFPWIRKITPKMPGFIADRTDIYKGKGPLIVGLLNGFLPCGPLYVVQLFALSTGSPLKGALSMLFFSLGTVPLLFGLGMFSSAIGRKSAQKVVTAGAVMIAVLGLCMLSHCWNLLSLTRPSFTSAQHNHDTVLDMAIDRGPQIINSTLSRHSYPSIRVEMDRPVKWIINAPEGSINSCNYKLFVREYGIEHNFRPGENIIEFTPKRKGRVKVSCWMGIMSGTIKVVGPGEIIDGLLEKRKRPPKEGEPCC